MERNHLENLDIDRRIISKRTFTEVWEISRNNAVGIATGYGLDDTGVASLSPDRVKNFLLFTLSRLALGPTQPPIQ
jgi:hypothetical protein